MGHTKEYWEKNKKKLLAKRKNRYATDPVYREQIKARAQMNREKKRAAKKREPFMMEHNGKSYVGVPIGDVCDKLGITTERMKYYQKRDYIPMAFVTVPKRYYTPHQISLIKKLVAFLKLNTHTIKKMGEEGEVARQELATIIETIHNTWEN